MSSALDGIQVLDLTDQRGELAGRILADLGATVLKIEPREGAASRHLLPFDSEGRSLYWACYGVGKQSLVLDLEDSGDRARFFDLVDHADVLIESFDPGVADRLGMDHDQLWERNPALIYMAITPFGRQGPKASWPATDLTMEAAGGRISLQGDADRPPLPVGFPQPSLHAGAQAAADIIIALNERERSGLGQFLDLSIQEAIWWTLMGAQGCPVSIGRNPPGTDDDRGGAPREEATRIFAAKDGLVTVAPGASPPGTRTMFTFAVKEALARGEADPALARVDWDNWLPLYVSGVLEPTHLQQAIGWLEAFVGRRTKLELVEWALENDLRLGPLHTTKDLVEFPQFIERGFFAEIGGILQPAHWVHMSRTPLVHAGAPDLGQLRQDSRIRMSRRSLPAPGIERNGNAFEGLKVADFSWVAAGPTIAKALADHGATVVKVESGTRPDLARTLAPHISGEAGLNRSYWSFLYGTSKLSLQCDLSTNMGRALARKVCDWADVVIESFSPGTMTRMGLDYNALAEGHRDLVMLSTSMLGQSGPFTTYAGYGQQAAGFCGFHAITGWQDRVPCGVATPYTDVVAPKFGIAALAAALLERRKSGLGQHIDLAQAECSMMFIAPLILDQVENDRTAGPAGDDSIYACPQGVYPCAGVERYIAIACETTEQWQKLAGSIPQFPFCTDEFDAVDARREYRERINQSIADWTARQDAFELERYLAARAVPASVVQRPLDVHNDAQIEARKLKQLLPHSECGEVIHYGFCTRFSAKPEMLRSAPPCLGENNEEVMRVLLGMGDDEVRAMYESGTVK